MTDKLDTLWYTRCPVPTGLGIAIQQGWLEDAFLTQGTKVSSLLESNDFATRESHFSHTLQNSVRHGGNIPAISAKARGRDTRVIGLSWADETQLILASPESGIETVRDLKGRRFGVPNWKQVEIDFTRAQAIRGLENALSLEGLNVSDVELVDQDIESHYSDERAENVGGTLARRTGGSRARANNLEVIALLRGEVDAIFLKGAHGAQVANQFGLTKVIDTGAHPEPLIRANNGTPRTLGAGSCVRRAPLSRPRDQFERILGIGRLWRECREEAQDRPRRAIGCRDPGFHQLPASLELHPAEIRCARLDRSPAAGSTAVGARSRLTPDSGCLDADGNLQAGGRAGRVPAAALPGDLPANAGSLRADGGDAVRGQSRARGAARAGRAGGS
jgi:ABC-type nitrate/sulfonate/bicarbonate transport system substrate-binding protein